MNYHSEINTNDYSSTQQIQETNECSRVDVDPKSNCLADSVISFEQNSCSKKNRGMQETDNFLFVCFFQFLEGKFEKEYTGCKKYNWKPATRRMNTKQFYQKHFKVFRDDTIYQNYEALLFKLIYPTYTLSTMKKHRFTPA